jgi:hypothetical protein
MKKRIEFGWSVEKKLTEAEAKAIFVTVRHAIYEKAKGELRKTAYYVSTNSPEISIAPDGHVTLLVISGNIRYGKPEDRERQVIFYRDDGDHFYLEGDLRADPTNQYAFKAALKKACEIWGEDPGDYGDVLNI